MHIAILGGSFDPIHKGHLQIAKTALQKLNIDEVWFMPTKNSPLKDGQSASFEQRVKMVELAITPYRHMKVCTLENELEQTSYTINTVEVLKKRFPNETFYWLIGDDQASQFSKWKDSERLKQEVKFYVFSRWENLELEAGLHRITMDLCDVSSSEIRKGKKRYMLAKSVSRYIADHGLYIEEMVANTMNEKRFKHSQSVAKLCVELARAHNLNEYVAYMMGICHDVCKYLPITQAQIWMFYKFPEHILEAKAIWHGYLGADYVNKYFDICDHRIREAIYHHVKGRNKTDYDRILFIADKLDPARGYDSSKEIAIAMKNLKLGFEVVKKQQVEYLKQEGK